MAYRSAIYSDLVTLNSPDNVGRTAHYCGSEDKAGIILITVLFASIRGPTNLSIDGAHDVKVVLSSRSHESLRTPLPPLGTIRPLSARSVPSGWTSLQTCLHVTNGRVTVKILLPFGPFLVSAEPPDGDPCNTRRVKPGEWSF